MVIGRMYKSVIYPMLMVGQATDDDVLHQISWHYFDTSPVKRSFCAALISFFFHMTDCSVWPNGQYTTG